MACQGRSSLDVEMRAAGVRGSDLLFGLPLQPLDPALRDRWPHDARLSDIELPPPEATLRKSFKLSAAPANESTIVLPHVRDEHGKTGFTGMKREPSWRMYADTARKLR